MAINNEMRDDVLEVYTAYYNRAVDADGFDASLIEMDTKGWDLLDVASSYTTSAEYVALYGGLSNEDMVKAVYTNVLNRTAEAEGLKYWSDELNDGTMAVDNLIVAIVNAATEVDSNGIAVHSADKAVVDNKTAVSQHYYDLGSNDVGISLSSVTSDVGSVDVMINAIEEDNNEGIQVAVALTDVDEDTATTPNIIDASDEDYIYTFDTTGNDSFIFTGFSEGDTLDINDDYTVLID